MSEQQGQQAQQQQAQRRDKARAKPEVLIVGGGIGGMMLALLLEQLEVPYQIFERASELRALGSVMTLGPNILPVFEQLNLLEELQMFSVPHHKAEFFDYFDETMTKVVTIEMLEKKDTGYVDILFERPRLYDLLRSRIPSHKIHLSKKITSTTESGSKVHIHCSVDNTTYSGDILVGADGAYSSIRKSLYQQLGVQQHQDVQQPQQHQQQKRGNILDKADLEEYSTSWVSTVGIAQLKDEDIAGPDAEFAILRDGESHFSMVAGSHLRSWVAVSVPGNRVCWSLSMQLSPSENENQKFYDNSTSWSYAGEASETMMKEYEDQPCPWTAKMNESADATDHQHRQIKMKALFDRTPRNLVSKVFLEEKMFKTWYGGRTVLMGDGAVNAMQDAVILANCIYNMAGEVSIQNIQAVFQEYVDQRYPFAHHAFLQSRKAQTSLYGQ
ncbi:hypothetical protein EDD11_003368, partial [Mortierella claussenii]